jgi:hypothetical protein
MSTRASLILRLCFAALLFAVLLMAENTPDSLRNNLCEWEWFEDCSDILLSEHVIFGTKFAIWGLVVFLLGWTVVALLIHDYRRTVVDVQFEGHEDLEEAEANHVETDPLIALKEAATIAYEETRGTAVAGVAERMSGGDVLGYYAQALFNKNTTLYGTYPPSRKLEAVSNEESTGCVFSADYDALRRHNEFQNLYENLQIRRSDVDRRIAELKSAATGPYEVSLSDVFYRIIDNSGWESEHGRDVFSRQAALALRQAARDKEITIRGQREGNRHRAGSGFDKTWEDIEPGYWRTHEFDVVAIMRTDAHYPVSETQVVSPGDIMAESLPLYAMLRVWNDNLEKRWPKANT